MANERLSSPYFDPYPFSFFHFFIVSDQVMVSFSSATPTFFSADTRWNMAPNTLKIFSAYTEKRVFQCMLKKISVYSAHFDSLTFSTIYSRVRMARNRTIYRRIMRWILSYQNTSTSSWTSQIHSSSSSSRPYPGKSASKSHAKIAAIL